MKKIISVMILISVILLATGGISFAQDRTTKLGRGIGNFFTGWVEIPKSVYDTTKKRNAATGLTLGLAKGLGMTIVRMGAGLYEAATFPFPLPSGYEPLLEPEFVFQDEKK